MSLCMRIHLVWPDRIPTAVRPRQARGLPGARHPAWHAHALLRPHPCPPGRLCQPHPARPDRLSAHGLPAPQRRRLLDHVARALTILASTFVQGGAAISGWTAYPPLSAIACRRPRPGSRHGSLARLHRPLRHLVHPSSAVNLLATIVAYRCPGMTWERLPLTVWAWFTAALLSVIAFSVLLAALLLLFSTATATPASSCPPAISSTAPCTPAATAARSFGSTSSGSSATPRSTSPSSPAWASPP